MKKLLEFIVKTILALAFLGVAFYGVMFILMVIVCSGFGGGSNSLGALLPIIFLIFCALAAIVGFWRFFTPSTNINQNLSKGVEAVVNYIKNSRAEGLKKETIIINLKSGGWNDDDIKEAFILSLIHI